MCMARDNSQDELDLTLFVACYNEEKNIVATLETVLAALKQFNYAWEIIVFDDASTDRSVEVVQEFLQKQVHLPIALKTRSSNVGLAQNFIDGAFLGRGKHYRLICGDN